MAEVNERRESGEGNSDGLTGGRATRRFDVFLDENGANDSETGQPDDRLNALAPIMARYPQGVQHHVNNLLVAQTYSQPTMKDMDATTSHWIVEVVYEGVLSAIGTVLGGWRIEFDIGIQTEQITHDLDGKLIGGHAYEFQDFAGPPKFVAQTIDGDIGLVQLDIDKVINPVPLGRFAPITHTRLTRQVSNLTTKAVKNAETFIATCNAQPFLTGEEFEILVAPARIRQVHGTAGAEGIETGILFDVELNFIKKRGGWVNERIADWFDYKGFRGAVWGPPNGDPSGPIGPISNDFRVYEAGNIYGLFQNFPSGGGGGSGRLSAEWLNPPQLAGIVPGEFRP